MNSTVVSVTNFFMWKCGNDVSLKETPSEINNFLSLALPTKCVLNIENQRSMSYKTSEMNMQYVMVNLGHHQCLRLYRSDE